MKKQLLYATMALALMGGATGCSDFGDVNNDPEQMTPQVMDFRLVFTHALTQSCGSDWDAWRNGCIYGANMMQHTTSVDWAQGVFYTFTNDYSSSYWSALYSGDRAVIRNLKLVMDQWRDDPQYANDYQMCRIVRAYVFQRMTDLHGDIPYTEAARGDEGIGYPKYDAQKDIYMDLLKELTEARDALDETAGCQMGAYDVVLNGDIKGWKRFANSLLLRVAMRLTKVDQTTAQQYVKDAFSHADLLIDDPANNIMVAHPDGQGTDDSAEPYGKIFSHEDTQAFYLSEYFINELKRTQDPRLCLIATRCDNPAAKWGDEGFDYGDSSDPDKLIGMPVGYETGDGNWSIKNAPGYPGENFRSYYALPNRLTYARPDVPTMWVTASETQLLLAEAALRGWVSGSAEDYYKKGVTAAMQQFSLYPAASDLYAQWITDANISAYLAANPMGTGEDAYKNINWQYYVTTFCDEYETFANWRRSGYPELTPVNKNYPSCETNGEIIRRFRYPINEQQINNANYNAAVERMGGDTFMTRVWWDGGK